MASADKRAKLLSDLLAAKGEASGNVSRTAEPESAPVIQIADRRVGEDRPSEAPAAPSVLYSKGTATASTFRRRIGLSIAINRPKRAPRPPERSRRC